MEISGRYLDVGENKGLGKKLIVQTEDKNGEAGVQAVMVREENDILRAGLLHTLKAW